MPPRLPLRCESSHQRTPLPYRENDPFHHRGIIDGLDPTPYVLAPSAAQDGPVIPAEATALAVLPEMMSVVPCNT